MKKLTICAMMLVGLAFCEGVNAKVKNTEPTEKSETSVEKTDKQQIEQVINDYQKALSTSNSTLATSLFTKNGKFMPSGGPSALGSEQIKESFDYVFTIIKPNITFAIEEVNIKGDQAYVTSTSKGTSLVQANGQTVPEINRELFIFEKENGKWKIARYMFNKMSQ